MKIFVKIFSGLVASCTWLIILAAAIFLIPRVAGYTPYVVMSGSMEPVIHTGAVAFINTKDTDCQVGDIITYRLKGNNGEEILVTHRIVEEQDGMYITQGDANEAQDLSPVSAEQIIGTYSWQIPMAGFVMAKLTSKTLPLLAGWIILLNLMSGVLSRVAEPEKLKEAAPPEGSFDKKEQNNERKESGVQKAAEDIPQKSA